MKVLMALVEREIRERRQLLLAAALLGVLALLSAWLPQAREVEPNEVRSTVALMMSGVLVICAAIALGYSLLSRDLGEGRLAFYFARPIPAWGLWCGKFLAVVLLLAATVLLVWLPTLLVGGSMALGSELLAWPEKIEIFQLPMTWAPRGRFFGPEMWLFSVPSTVLDPYPLWFWATAGLLLLVLVTHIVAVILRSASPRILIDMAALVVVMGLAWSAGSRLVENGASGTLTRSQVVLVISTLGALFISGLWQTSIGRTSPVRAHVVLSAAVWGLLLLIVVGFEIVSRQVVQADLEDLAQVNNMVTAARGDWMVVGGPARGQTETGRRLAVVDQGRLSVYEISSTAASSAISSVKTLAVVELGRPGVPMGLDDMLPAVPRFSGKRLRVLFADTWTMETVVNEFDLNSRQLTELARLPGIFSEYSAKGDLVAIWGHREDVRVFRAADLSLVANLMDGEHGSVDDVRFLEDSGWILTERHSKPSRVRRLDASGRELWSLEIARSLVFLGLEESPGRLWLGVWQWGKEGEDESEWSHLEDRRVPSWARGDSHVESRLLDLKTGRVLLTKSEYLPNWHAAPAGSPATRILLGQRGIPTSVEVLDGREAGASSRVLLEIFDEEPGDS